MQNDQTSEEVCLIADKKNCLVKAGLFPRRTRNFSIDATLKTPFDHPTKRFFMRTLSHRRFWIENFTTRRLDA